MVTIYLMYHTKGREQNQVKHFGSGSVYGMLLERKFLKGEGKYENA